MAKKIVKITREREQTRVTVPKQFVDEFNITREDRMEWDSSNGKLKCYLRKNDDKHGR